MDKNLCKSYLKLKPKFLHILEKECTPEFITDLDKLANSGNADVLRSKLDDLWFDLPDKYNIQEEQEGAPHAQGWSAFLSLVDD